MPGPCLGTYVRRPSSSPVCVFRAFLASILLKSLTSHMCEIKSFSGTTESLRTPFSEKCAGMAGESVRFYVLFNLCHFLSSLIFFSVSIVLKALLFSNSGSYVNTARVDPSLLRVESSRLRVVDTKSLAICIMTGTVTESFLLASAEAGPRHSPYAIHKITVAPFEQDFRRDTSTWGLLFNFRVITGMISSVGFGFASRGEGKGDNWRTREFFSYSYCMNRSQNAFHSFCSSVPCEGESTCTQVCHVTAFSCFCRGRVTLFRR